MRFSIPQLVVRPFVVVLNFQNPRDTNHANLSIDPMRFAGSPPAHLPRLLAPS